MSPPQETVEVVPKARGLWAPKPGPELDGLLARIKLDEAERNTVRSEALEVLSKCPPPRGKDQRATGLVVGYVQSGKTLNFTAVTTAARDNDYPIVIVIAGTSIPLFRQSEERLARDLNNVDRQWRPFSNPSDDKLSLIAATLADWRDPDLPKEEKQTVLITVMKHHQHLVNLIDLLESLDLRGLPAIIIDDEGDHAGLNTLVKKDDESRTYQRLNQLRDAVPHHAYLIYTATPQAPLLISAIDSMSPEFSVTLTPGREYTGGQTFFEVGSDLAVEIPEDEIVTGEDDEPEGPPASLIDALRFFFVGVAAGMVTKDKRQRAKNRSMMVHPSQYRQSHTQHRRWIDGVMTQWLRVFAADPDDEAREAATAAFKLAYDDILAKEPAAPAWADVARTLPRAIAKTAIETVNSGNGKTPTIDWAGNYSWILVGGQAMDRGFTVEGLTVTYMPRGLGVRNADSVQQRARFFGYKEPYLSYCRVYLQDDALDAYTKYVDHEQDLRTRLKKHEATGKPLTQWKRAFFLDPEFNATRSNVLNLDYEQDVISDEWFFPRQPHLADLPRQNRELVERFAKSAKFVFNPAGYKRPTHQHSVAKGLSLDVVLRELLVDARMGGSKDSFAYTGALLQIQRYQEENPDATCTVYLMSRDGRDHRTTDPDDNEVKALHQGAYPPNGSLQGAEYPGDKMLRDDPVTVQVHRLNVDTATGRVEDVPFISVWLSSALANPWYVQEKES